MGSSPRAAAMGGVQSDPVPPWPNQWQQQQQPWQVRDRRAADLWASGGAELLEAAAVPRPTTQPGLQQIKVFKNPLHVKGKTIRLSCAPTPTPDGGRCWELTFAFDALVPCEVQIHAGAAGSESCGELVPGLASWSSEPRGYGPMLGAEHRGPVDLGGLLAQQVNFCIELRSLSDAPPSQPGWCESAAEWTLGSFVPRAGCNLVDVELGTQRVRLPETGFSPSYEMHEVFGGEPQGPAALGHECVICMSERRDTALLPCRHMCLCGACAETMRSRVQYRSYRCPICRERVSSLLQIRKPAMDDAAVAGAFLPGLL